MSARVWRAGGVHRKLWHVRRDAPRNLGNPGDCLAFQRENGGGVPSQGKPLLRGGGCPRSTLRGRKTSTWERGAREGAARTGNFCRTRRAGAQEPTSLRGIANQVDRLPDTEASPTEEPCEGKLHAGICAGGAGRPAFLPRRRLYVVVKIIS